MVQELLGIPGMNRGLAATRINEAFQRIQNDNVWSFQCITNGWLTPSLLGSPTTTFLSPGTITVTPFTNTITGDAVATAAWNGVTNFPLLTQQQIRIPYYSLYNIIAQGTNGVVAYVNVVTPGSGQTPGTYSVPISDQTMGTPGSGAEVLITVNANGQVTLQPTVLSGGTGYTMPYITFSEGGTAATFQVFQFATLTIDRPWMEPAQAASNYMIYQAYYPAPPGFKRFFNIRDTTNNILMDFWSKTQIDLANDDPQRTIFDQPYFVVPYQIDTRPGSATLGQQLFELWPHAISSLPYTFMCQANWAPLQYPTDTLPSPLTDELVKERAYEMVALWKESQKGDEMERGSGTNWQFLVKAHHEEYKDLLRQIRIMDRHLMELYFTKARMEPPYGGEPYSSPNGNTNIGWF